MNTFKSICFAALLVAFSSCSEKDKNKQYPVPTGTYAVTLAKSGTIPLENVKGTVTISNVQGATTFSLKDFESKRSAGKKLAATFKVRLDQQEGDKSYKVTYEKQEVSVERALKITLPVDAAEKTAIQNLLSVDTNEIALEAADKKMKIVTEINNLKKPVGAIKQEGAKTIIEIGGVFKIKQVADLKDPTGTVLGTTFVSALKDSRFKTELERALKTFKNPDAKKELNALVTGFIAKLKAGIPEGKTRELTITAVKQK